MTNVLYSSKRVLEFMSAHLRTKTLNPDELVLVGFQECFALRTGCLLYVIMTVFYWFECLVSKIVGRKRWRVVEASVSIIVYGMIWVLCGWYVLLSLFCRMLGYEICFGHDCGTGIWWDPRSAIAKPFKAMGLNPVPTVGVGGRRGALVDDGLMLLTNVPRTSIEEPFKVERFASARGTEVLANKGFQYGKIVLNDRRYLVVHTHLQDPSDPCCCGDANAYKDQVAQLIDRIKKEQAPTMTTILMGDLNSAAVHPEEYERIKNSLNLMPCASTLESLDHILMSATTQECRTRCQEEEDPFSDHPMIMYRSIPHVFTESKFRI